MEDIKMTNDELKDAIEYFKKQGKQIRVRDIAFALLRKMFENDITAYQCLFGNEGFEAYVSAPERKEIEDYLKLQGHIRAQELSDSELSWEENKREMAALLKKTQEALDNGFIEAKDGLRIMADIRVKLNDKFNIQEEQQERVIQVLRKFNAVCECGREIYKPTKLELMEEYGLIEKQ
jgi:hypothetical protein